jgi:hypothetical protein
LVNTFSQQWVDAQQWNDCWEMGFPTWSVPRGYKCHGI